MPAPRVGALHEALIVPPRFRPDGKATVIALKRLISTATNGRHL
jgi:hypothetical protein